LYGAKQSAYEWRQKFDKFLKDNKSMLAFGDPCVYIEWSDFVHVAVILDIIFAYVDDLMVFPSSEDWMTPLRATIRTTFDITDEGICTWILGVGVDYDLRGNITLQQHKYITDMLTDFNMIDSNPSLLPFSPRS
jgi:hypothetical protein